MQRSNSYDASRFNRIVDTEVKSSLIVEVLVLVKKLPNSVARALLLKSILPQAIHSTIDVCFFIDGYVDLYNFNLKPIMF